MKKEVFELVRKESVYFGLLFLIAIAIFKIGFLKEDFFILFRNVLSIFWLFALPGYFVMLYWHDKLGFFERFIIGIVLSAVVIGVSSYYLGIIGVNIKYHTILLPSILIALGLVSATIKE